MIQYVIIIVGILGIPKYFELSKHNKDRYPVAYLIEIILICLNLILIEVNKPFLLLVNLF